MAIIIFPPLCTEPIFGQTGCTTQSTSLTGPKLSYGRTPRIKGCSILLAPEIGHLVGRSISCPPISGDCSFSGPHTEKPSNRRPSRFDWCARRGTKSASLPFQVSRRQIEFRPTVEVIEGTADDRNSTNPAPSSLTKSGIHPDGLAPQYGLSVRVFGPARYLSDPLPFLDYDNSDDARIR
jgi:hypothetical protein